MKWRKGTKENRREFEERNQTARDRRGSPSVTQEHRKCFTQPSPIPDPP